MGLVDTNINEFRDLLKVLNINSIEDIPSRDEIVTRLKSGNYTFRDSWFAKMYDQGLNVPGGILKSRKAEDIHNIAKHLKKNFPLRIKTGQGIGPIAKTIKQIGNKFKTLKTTTNTLDYLNLSTTKYKDFIESKDIFKGNRTQINALYTSTENVSKGSLAKGESGVTRIFNAIPDDDIIRRILLGIRDIPNQAHREFLLLNLFGTRGEQNRGLVAGRELALDVSPERPFYGRQGGSAVAVEVLTGRKPLANVPFGPFIRDMLNKRWDRVTGKGANLYVEMWGDIDDDLDLGKLIDEYLFNNPNGKSVLTDEQIAKLGREPNGFTDLRRLVLSWASKLDNPALAAELLTHGTKKSHDALDLVTNKHYIPSEGTPTEVMRNFTTRIEQKVAQVLGHTNYKSLNTELKVRKYNTFSKGVQFLTNQVVIPENLNKSQKGVITEIIDETSIDDAPVDEDEIQSRKDAKKAAVDKGMAADRAAVDDLVRETYKKNIKLDPNYTMADAERVILEGRRKKPLSKGGQSLIDHVINKTKGEAREIVGDISQTWDRGVERLTSKQTYKGIAEAALDPEEWQRTASKLVPLVGLVGGKFVKAGKLAKGAGKLLLTPSKGVPGRAEVTAETQILAEDMSGVTARKATLAQVKRDKKLQEQMGDIEHSILQNKSLIGDDKVEETEEQRINRQMMEAGFGA